MQPARSHRQLRLRLAAAVVAAAVVAAGSGAFAQTERIDQAKAERDAAIAELAEAAASLDPLLAEDSELETAVAALELNVAAKQANLDATRQALSAAREESEAATEAVVGMSDTIEQLRASLRSQVIEVYVSPDAARLDGFLTSDDITVAALKRALLDTVAGSEVDALERLRAAQARLADLEAEAALALSEVSDKEAVELAQLLELEKALDDSRRMRSALEQRIAEVHAEISALEEEEEALSVLIANLIAEEEARSIALEEARRRAAEAARLAAQSELAREQGSEGPVVPAPLPAPPSASGLVWPTAGVVSSYFGPRWGRQHQGIDIAGESGSAVVAAQSGTVVSAGPFGSYGQMVVVDHGGGFTTIYAHLSSLSVSVGQAVSRGAPIGALGCTGSCTGPHLHFETRVVGVAQDPILYL